MPSASAASAGIASFTADDDATSACVVNAPMTIASPSFLMPFSSAMPDKSTTVPGFARRSFIAPTRLCPPASALPLLLLSAAAASATLFARWYSNAYMFVSSMLRRLNRVPHPMRRRRHVDVFNAGRSQSIMDGIHQRRRSADRSGFAATLGPERIVRARRDLRRDLEGRQVGGARHRVVHVAAGQKLAGLLVVHAALEQRLADALRQSAVHLAFDDHRIDDVAEVVASGKIDNLHDAGLGIDLDLTDVRTCREREIGRIVECGLVEAGLQLVERIVVRHVRSQRDFAEGLAAVGAGDAELAVLELDVGF